MERAPVSWRTAALAAFRPLENPFAKGHFAPMAAQFDALDDTNGTTGAWYKPCEHFVVFG
jgi:hypothetical protein